jgi:hypothetical protein
MRPILLAFAAVPFVYVAPAHAGPIPCLDGSTVEFGQFCPAPETGPCTSR